MKSGRVKWRRWQGQFTVMGRTVRRSRSSDVLWRLVTRCLTDQQIWFPVDFQEFPGHILTKIKYTLQFLFKAVSKLNEEVCGDRPHPTLITRSIGELPDTYTDSINWSWFAARYFVLIHSEIQECNINNKRANSQTRPENFQKTLYIFSRFPGFPGGRNNSSRFAGFPGFSGVRHPVVERMLR